MISSFLKNQSTSILGATFILVGAVALPSSATTLVGFSTYGNMMGGMRVTASFLDGTAQTAIWGATGKETGGAFGSGWSLIQSGNSFDSPWTLSNYGQGMTSLVIDAIAGNALFDIYPYGDNLPQTEGSADGWAFEPLSGQSPNGWAYSDPIDISLGDLFGTISLYWGGGFTGTMQFRADTDSGSGYDPVQPSNPVVRNAAPTLYFSLPTIYEGQSTSTTLYATEPGEDTVAFFLNGGNLGTDFSRSGTRSISTYLGFFADNGVHLYTAQARDEDGLYSNPVTSTLNVLNVAPTLTAFNLSNDTIYEGQDASAWLAATDPGADWQNFFINDNYVGTDWLASGTRSTSAYLGTFADEGEFTFIGQAQDKDNAFSNILTRTLNVLNVAPTITQLTQNLRVKTNEWFDFGAAAIDPGIYDLLTFDWDLNGDGLFDDFTGSSGQWSFGQEGTYPVGLRVSDGDGGYAYGSFTVDTFAPQPISENPGTDADTDETIVEQKIPEPSSVLGVLAFGAFSMGAVWKRKR